MLSTPPSLLERLRLPNQQDAWSRFVQLYTPLLFHWGRRLGLREAEIADLVQEVLLLLLRKLPDFAYDPSKSFRGWLRTVMLNIWRNLEAKGRPEVLDRDLDQFAAAHADGVGEEAEYRAMLVGRALQILRAEFPEAVWQPFWHYAVEGKRPHEVARELGVSVNVVYLSKSRVLTRLRRELKGLIE